MEQFRKSLKKKIWVNSIVFILAICAIILVAWIPFMFKIDEIPDFTKGFQFGGFVGMSIPLLFRVFIYIRAFKNPEYFKKLYIKETDERECLIQQKSCSIAMSITLIGLCLATIITGFFNYTVFFTLLITTVCVLFVYLASVIYYSKTL